MSGQSRAAAEITDDRPPSPDHADPPFVAGNEHRPRSDNRDRAVAVAERALKRNPGIGFDVADAKRQESRDPAGLVADIGAGEAQDRHAFADPVFPQPGFPHGKTDCLDDVVARGIHVGRDIRRAGKTFTERGAVSIGHDRPAACAATVHCDEIRHSSTSRMQTNLIPFRERCLCEKSHQNFYKQYQTHIKRGVPVA
jgi:hypothetical protein